MDLSLPNTVPPTQPGEPYKARDFVFNHIPDLRELLPKFRGRPGFEYLQCCLINLRRAQDEGWTEVDNTVIYIVQGPKGEANMKLMGRGQPIPGQPHNSGARLCVCDKTVEDLTGLWINPHQHKDEGTDTLVKTGAPEGGDTQKRVEETPTPEPEVFRSGGGPSAS